MEGGGRGGHFILIKGTANQDDITILNMHTKHLTPNFIKKKKPTTGAKDTDKHQSINSW